MGEENNGVGVGAVGPRALRALLSLDAFPFRLVDCSPAERDKPFSNGRVGALVGAGRGPGLTALFASVEEREGAKAASAARESTVRFPVGGYNFGDGDRSSGDGGGSEGISAWAEETVGDRAASLFMSIPEEALAVVVDDDSDKAKRVAEALSAAARSAGARRQVAYAREFSAAPDAEAAGSPAFVSRHVAKALQARGRAIVVDMRRPEERERFGAIPGSLPLPVQDVPSALGLSTEEFRGAYGFDREAGGKNAPLVIMQCRTHRRSHWASIAFEEEGVKSALPDGRRHAVLRDGVYGWRLDAEVQRYKGYDGPRYGVPEPEPFDLEAIDEDAARAELQLLGLPTL